MGSGARRSRPAPSAGRAAAVQRVRPARAVRRDHHPGRLRPTGPAVLTHLRPAVVGGRANQVGQGPYARPGAA